MRLYDSCQKLFKLKTQQKPRASAVSFQSALGQSFTTDKNDQLSKQIIIPTYEWSKEQKLCDQVMSEAQHLARQDQIAKLFDRIEQSAKAGKVTGSGHLQIDYLMVGARLDIVSYATLAAQRGLPLAQYQGIADLEFILEEFGHDKTALAFVWFALHDIEQSYLRHATELCQSVNAAGIQKICLERLGQHLKSDYHLPTWLAQFERELQRAQLEKSTALAIDIITHIPKALMVMRRLAHTRAQLEEHAKHNEAPFDLMARRMAAASYDRIGHAGYAWMYLEGILVAPRLMKQMDQDFFEDGLNDLITHFPDQGIFNHLISRLHIVAEQLRGEGALQGRDQLAQRLEKISQKLIRSHLNELHPLIWAEALERTTPNAHHLRTSQLVTLGYDMAMNHLVRDFSGPLSSGHAVVFTKNGVDLIAQRI